MHVRGAVSSLPAGIATAIRAAGETSDVGAALRALRARIVDQAVAGVWISLVDAAALEARIAELVRIAQRELDIAARRRRYPLFGVPFAVKDNIDVEGFATTAACPAFVYRPDSSAHAVQRLLDAGAVCMGKTNLDQFATGLVGTRTPYGVPACAFDGARVSGGSSSGSALAVALGQVAFALGTDTAGSGRVPAGFNDLVGLKPTPGRVSTHGVVPACRTLDCVSVFAHDVTEAAAVLAVMEGADARDPYSRFAPGAARLPEPLRVGVPAMPAFLPTAVGRAYTGLFERARNSMAALAVCTEIDFTPLDAVARLLYDGPWVAERDTVVDRLMATQRDALDPTVATVIAGAARFSATDAFRAQYRLQAMRQAAERIWRDVDVLLVPTAPGHPLLSEVAADPIGANAQLGRYTNFVNLLGWCALALPYGYTDAGLPFGITLIAPGGSDAALAALGVSLEHQFPRADARPQPARVSVETEALPWPASAPSLPIAVVGAHLSGLPLNAQLTARGARMALTTTTAPRYRLFALPDTTPPKPGLLRVADGEPGHAVALEVWDVPLAAVGSFLALVPPPLCIGTIELADGRHVHGFVCEPHALVGARDISDYGGWRAYLQAEVRT